MDREPIPEFPPLNFATFVVAVAAAVLGWFLSDEFGLGQPIDAWAAAGTLFCLTVSVAVVLAMAEDEGAP